jgi:hypothetical protein
MERKLLGAACEIPGATIRHTRSAAKPQARHDVYGVRGSPPLSPNRSVRRENDPGEACLARSPAQSLHRRGRGATGCAPACRDVSPSLHRFGLSPRVPRLSNKWLSRTCPRHFSVPPVLKLLASAQSALASPQIQSRFQLTTPKSFATIPPPPESDTMSMESCPGLDPDILWRNREWSS